MIYRNHFTGKEIQYLTEKGLLVDGNRKTAAYKIEDLFYNPVCRKDQGRIVWLEDK